MRKTKKYLEDEKTIINASSEELKKLNFKYDCEIDNLVYTFVCYKGNRVNIYCKLWGTEGELRVLVYDSYSKQPYPAFYDRTYGQSDVIVKIDKNIIKEVSKLANALREGENNGEN